MRDCLLSFEFVGFTERVHGVFFTRQKHFHAPPGIFTFVEGFTRVHLLNSCTVERMLDLWALTIDQLACWQFLGAILSHSDRSTVVDTGEKEGAMQTAVCHRINTGSWFHLDRVRARLLCNEARHVYAVNSPVHCHNWTKWSSRGTGTSSFNYTTNATFRRLFIIWYRTFSSTNLLLQNTVILTVCVLCRLVCVLT